MNTVFDSSTLILLAKIEILRIVSDDIHIVIPERVETECTAKESFDGKLISTLIEEGKIRVEKIRKREIINKLCKDFKLHIGEAEALYMAVEKGCPIAVDDLPTIKACKVLNQGFTTAIHFLINIFKDGRIDMQTAIVKLEKLSLYGRYNRRIIDNARKRLEGGN
jgi:predicted nucleic acid-binding protein